MTNVSTHDPLSTPAFGRSIGSYFATALLIVCLAALAALFLFMAIDLHRASLWVSVPLWGLSAALMLAVLRALVMGLRRRWATGRFLATPAELAARRAKYLATVGAGKPLAPQAKYWILPLAVLSALAYFGTLVAVAAFRQCECSHWLMALLLILSATFLLPPGVFIFKAVQRRIRTGHFLPTEEELAKLRARCARPPSGWQRIGSAVVWTLVAIMWTLTAWRGHAHPSQWIVAGVNWLAAAVWIWRAIHPARLACSTFTENTHQPSSGAPLG